MVFQSTIDRVEIIRGIAVELGRGPEGRPTGQRGDVMDAALFIVTRRKRHQ